MPLEFIPGVGAGKGTEKRRQYWLRSTHTLSLPTPLPPPPTNVPNTSSSRWICYLTQKTAPHPDPPGQRHLPKQAPWKLSKSSSKNSSKSIDESGRLSLQTSPFTGLPGPFNPLSDTNKAHSWNLAMEGSRDSACLINHRTLYRAPCETIIPKTLLGATDLLSLIPFYLTSRAIYNSQSGSESPLL